MQQQRTASVRPCDTPGATARGDEAAARVAVHCDAAASKRAEAAPVIY